MSKLSRFIGGFAKTTLDNIQLREKEERDFQREQLLQKLRIEQAKEIADYTDLLERKRVSKDLSSTDYVAGKRTLRDADGNVIGELDVPESEKAQYKFEQNKQNLEIRNLESQISSRAADDARQDRSTGAYIRSLDRQGLGGGTGSTLSGPNGTVTSQDRANEIAFRQKSLVDDLIKSGVPADAVQMTILRSLKNAAARGLPPSAAEGYFIQAADLLRKSYQEGGMAGKNNTLLQRKSLDGSE